VGTETLVRQTELLVGQIAHWTPARWKGRGDAVHALVQRLADAGAQVEGEPLRPVPRLADTVLPDQLRVVVADLVAAQPSAEMADHLAEDIRQVKLSL
jgi:hypothetical protein